MVGQGCRLENPPETRDAILWLPDASRMGVGKAEEGATPEALKIALEEAEADLRIYVESLTATREAIEEAVVMVQEQRENFDYALNRFETLMPLVETGALEPLAASQIQSAYISARASLAQAKFFLGQARRDFGSEEVRRRRLSNLQGRVEMLRQQLGLGEENLADALEEEVAAATEPGPLPLVEAYFHGAGPELVVGQRAVFFLADSDVARSARVQRIEVAAGQGPSAVWLEPILEPSELAEILAGGRPARPVRVKLLAESRPEINPETNTEIVRQPAPKEGAP